MLPEPFFFNRDFTPRAIQPAVHWRVRQMTWAALGGPDSAELLSDLVEPPLPALWADLLRCPVEISHAGLPVWWGYVNSVALRRGDGWLQIALDDCATCVRVDWRPAADSVAVSVFARDAAQIACFGERQYFVNQGTSGDSLSAASSAEGWLARLLPSAAQWAGAAGDQTGSVRLGLRGWWHTLGWRYREPLGEGCSLWEAAPDEDHALGYNASTTRAAQPFISPQQPLIWYAYTLRVNLRKVGSPADRVRISIQSSSGGSPAGVELDAVEIPATMLTTSLNWYDLRFDNLLAAIQPGQMYHLVLQRTGNLSSTNYYRVGLDLLPQPLPGVQYYQLFNGSTWSQRAPAAAAVYALQGASENTQLIAYYGETARGGQFLNGVRLDEAAGRFLPVNKNAIYSYLHEITGLLNLGAADGARLLAEITPRRGLRIYRAQVPDELLPDRPQIAEDGSLAGGDAFWQARVGCLAQQRGWRGAPVFLERVVWDGERLWAG